LKIVFGPREKIPIEVFVGDSIREFKGKVTEACRIEAQKWASSQGPSSPEAAKFKDVKIGAEHLVMVFVAPSRLTALFQQGMKDTEEYTDAYTLASQDPNNWEPLDPTRTFDQYNPRFAFGKPEPHPPQILRVVEATEKYKLVNLRYRQFDAERKKKLTGDMNEDDKCFGWAKYQHTRDVGAVAGDGTATCSYEWRPAIISKPERGGAAQATAPTNAPAPAEGSGKRLSLTPESTKFSVSWLVKPTVDAKPVELDRASVLMAPKAPKVDHYVHPKHLELLKQARNLRMMGKSEYEIEAMLNKMLEDQINQKTVDKDKAKTSASKPPRITVAIIRQYLAHEP